MGERYSVVYRNGATPPFQKEYVGFVFAFDQPLFVAGKYVGNPINLPDGVEKLINCNLVNAVPPVGVECISCNTTIVQRGIARAPFIDKFDDIIHGHTDVSDINSRASVYKPAPITVNH